MSRYIDADELTEFYEPYKDMQVPVNALLEQIKDTSTVDAVEVVRCKDCKYAMTQDCPMDEQYEDDYCSYGERKEQEYERSRDI